MIELYGLDKLRESSGREGEVYCPKCRNYLTVVDNGWFHGQLFYCPKDKQVFCIQLKDITNKAGEKFIKSSEKLVKWKRIKASINYTNMDIVDKVLTPTSEGKEDKLTDSKVGKEK
jgi:hypothetical protein